MQLSTIHRRLGQGRKQAGDTIVEVLICIGVISLVLTGAFAISNASTSTVQDSGEHATASLYLQSQVEALRTYLRSDDATVPAQGTEFCMNGAGSLVAYTDAACSQDVSTADYKLKFTRDAGGVYTFVVNWDSIKGGPAKESYVYRDYI